MDLFHFSNNSLQSYERNEYVSVPNKYKWNVYATKHINLPNAETQNVELLRIFEKLFGKRMYIKREMTGHPIDLQRLMVSDAYLSDQEVRLASEYSQWKFPTNDILVLDSGIVKNLGIEGIIWKDTGVATTRSNSIPNMCKIEEWDVKQIGKQKYIVWEHKMKYLSSTIQDFVHSKKNFIFVHHNYVLHWNFLLAVYFPSDKHICVYLFDSLNEDSKESLNTNATKSTNARIITLVRFLKLLLLIRKHHGNRKNQIIIKNDENTVLINDRLKTEMKRVTDDRLHHVKVVQQCDGYSCGLHTISFSHSVLGLIHKEFSKNDTKRQKFEEKLYNCKSLNCIPDEYKDIRKDLLDFTFNLSFYKSIIQKERNDIIVFKEEYINDEPFDEFKHYLHDLRGDLTDICSQENKKKTKLLNQLRRRLMSSLIILNLRRNQASRNVNVVALFQKMIYLY